MAAQGTKCIYLQIFPITDFAKQFVVVSKHHTVYKINVNTDIHTMHMYIYNVCVYFA